MADIRLFREEDPNSGQVITRYLDSETLEEVTPPYYHLGTREQTGFPDEDFEDPRKAKKPAARRTRPETSQKALEAPKTSSQDESKRKPTAKPSAPKKPAARKPAPARKPTSKSASTAAKKKPTTRAKK